MTRHLCFSISIGRHLCSKLTKDFPPKGVMYSTQLTFETIFSEENKTRTQKALPESRPVRTFKDYNLKEKYSYAAVLVPLCVVNGEPSLLFTLRSPKLMKHRGEVSFPGGNVDKTDSDFVATAIRETEEELGISASNFDVWGQMNSLPGSGGRKIVYPIVAKIKDSDLDITRLQPNMDEVDEVFTVPIQHFCQPHHQRMTRFRESSGRPYTIPVYIGAQHRIWGLTSIITHQLLCLFAPGLYNFKVVHKRGIYQDRAGRARHSYIQK